ncbi:alpha/beta fold hydrolase [Nocardia fluminea]|uniref:Pimeloyl-ACP methyl ester carboxylesterase n=1 Tax=Nocardia fluminea TaxID=134984 RepID=A0A2N3V6B1_9NOCA|nr:alpha/beta hydrolase [Nocardia fluminea]PKV77146.1 pimeloyl-ACP methyl ester carboxylesterase [Nocardia fluminea]
MVSLPAGRVHLRVDGPAEGDPLLLVHGFEGSMHWWDRVTPLLAERFRVIRVDLLGYGCTSGDAAIGQAAQSAMLASILDHLDVTAVTAVGHSWGADQILETARRSSRVGAVVVLAQAPDYRLLSMPRVLQAITASRLAAAVTPIARLLHAVVPDRLVRDVLQRGFAPGFDPSAMLEDSQQFVLDFRAMSYRMYHEVVVRRRELLHERPLDTRVRELGLPTMAVHGRHDRLYDCDATLARYAAVGARTEVIGSAGHSPHVEAPHEVAALIRDFVDRLQT